MNQMKSPSSDNKRQDSKISRQFLRMVLNCLGQKIPEELDMNSWELYDLIEKDISIIRTERARDRKNIRSLLSGNESRRQFTIQAIDNFYDKEEERRRKGEGWYKEMETKKERKVEQLDEN